MNNTKYQLASPSVSSPTSQHFSKIDWEKCFICQFDIREKLICPASTKQRSSLSIEPGYLNIAENLLAFNSIGSLPKSINLSQLNDGSGVAKTLSNNTARFHDSCRLKYNKTMLKRVSHKRKCEESSDECSQQMKRALRKCTDNSVCFFCEKPSAPSNILHEAMTKTIGERVRQCAIDIGDSEVLAKVGTADFVANEVKYHAKCLANYHNRGRKRKDSSTSSEHVLKARAFAELVSFIDERISDPDTAPVFKLTELVQLYSSRVAQLNGGTTKDVHSTRLKDQILAHFPELCASQAGREILLVLNKDVGAALRKACELDANEEACILARAAAIIRKQIFKEVCEFKGSFDEDSQEDSVPSLLDTMMMMILFGPNIESQTSISANQRQKALTLGQLAVFNCVQCTARGISSRHSKKREPPLPVYIGAMIHTKTRKRGLIDKMFHLGLSVSYDRVLQISTDLGNTITKVCNYNILVKTYSTLIHYKLTATLGLHI